jgi:hypothetical protein
MYTLACTNHAGTSQPASVTLTVTAAAASGGGGGHGGSMDLAALLTLSGVLLGRALLARRARPQIKRLG